MKNKCKICRERVYGKDIICAHCVDKTKKSMKLKKSWPIVSVVSILLLFMSIEFLLFTSEGVYFFWYGNQWFFSWIKAISIIVVLYLVPCYLIFRYNTKHLFELLDAQIKEREKIGFSKPGSDADFVKVEDSDGDSTEKGKTKVTEEVVEEPTEEKTSIKIKKKGFTEEKPRMEKETFVYYVFDKNAVDVKKRCKYCDSFISEKDADKCIVCNEKVS